jgi:hypothetical protein
VGVASRRLFVCWAPAGAPPGCAIVAAIGRARRWGCQTADRIAASSCKAWVPWGSRWWRVPEQAEPAAKVPPVGYLTGASFAAIAARTEAFRQGLRELGYTDGENIVIEWRSSEGKLDQLPALAAELVGLNVDVIVTGGPQATRPAKAATDRIPIVMALDTDPVGNGFVAILARPGGNITGLSTLSPELSAKRLELLKESLPVIYDRPEYVHAGGLIFYGVSIADLDRRAATVHFRAVRNWERRHEARRGEHPA